MATTTDGKPTEPCPECGKPIKWSPNGMGMRRHMSVHKVDEPITTSEEALGAQQPLFSEPPPVVPTGEEPAPTRPKRKLKDRLFGPSEPKREEPRTSERRPSTPRPKRVDSSEMLGRLWGWVGRKVEEQYSVPTGRALMIEAEPAGMILADAVKDTSLDRPVQWCARQYAAGSSAFALFRFPVAVEMGARQIMADGQLSPMVLSEISESLLDLAPYLVKVVRREQKKARDFSDAMEGLREAFGVPEGQPITISDVLGYLYPQPAAGAVVNTAREPAA